MDCPVCKHHDDLWRSFCNNCGEPLEKVREDVLQREEEAETEEQEEALLKD